MRKSVSNDILRKKKKEKYKMAATSGWVNLTKYLRGYTILEKKFSSKKYSKWLDKKLIYFKMTGTTGLAVFTMGKNVNQWLL
jgi:hypothetical protein